MLSRLPAILSRTRGLGHARAAALLLAAALPALHACGSGSTDPGWNVLLISVDTLRADHLGAYGYDRATSPRIDALAAESAVFTQAICQNTNTNPSHASILSGLYPRSHGNWDNFYRMADDVPMLPDSLRQRGFSTAAFVSGYTLKDTICGLARGFDLYDDDFSGKERRGNQTTDRALAWLDEHAGERFFLFVHLFDPHGPYDPPADAPARFEPRTPPRPVPLTRIPRYQRLPVGAPDEELWTDLSRYEARYDEEIAFADQQVGRLLDALDRLGLGPRTLVLLTSDHGEALDERHHLLDHGGGVGDEEIRVPLMLRLPDGRFAGRRIDGQAQSIDIAPTLAGILGVPVSEAVQGADLRPWLEGRDDAPHAATFTETRVIPRRWGDRSYDLNVRDTLKAVRRPDAKLLIFPGKPRPYLELYDLTLDPGERRDVAGERPELMAEMAARLELFMALPARWNEVASPDSDSETREIFRTLGYVD